MGIEERKEREKQRRSRAIIDAAEKIIFAKGLENATMTEIAREAELSKGTLYLYFQNKNELYLAIARRGSDLLHEKLAELFSGALTGIELIREMGETYLGFVRRNPGYFNAFVYYKCLSDEELDNSEMIEPLNKNTEEAMGFMVRALQTGMEDGTIKSSYNPEELAVIIWASTRGITMFNHQNETGPQSKIPHREMIETSSLFENFLNIIGEGIATGKGKKEGE